MLGAASRMVTFYFARCLGGALFIKCRLTLSTLQPWQKMKECFKPPLKSWARWQTEKAIIRQDSAYHWVLEGHSSSPGISITLLCRSILKPTAHCETGWIMDSCFASHKEAGVRVHLDTHIPGVLITFCVCTIRCDKMGNTALRKVKKTKQKIFVSMSCIRSLFLSPLSIFLSSFCCSASTFCTRLRQRLLFCRSEIHCMVFDRHQLDQDAKWNQKCRCWTLTFSLYLNKVLQRIHKSQRRSDLWLFL